MDERLDEVMRIMDAAFDAAFGEAWNRQQVSDALTTPNTHLLVAPSQTAGEGDGFLLSRAAPGEEELLLLAVRPECRRRGVASRLLEEFKKAAEARGAERLFLEVRVNNPAQDFYRLHGFQQIGRRRDYYRQPNGERLDAITFGFNFPPSG